jgi:hypothetical protein
VGAGPEVIDAQLKAAAPDAVTTDMARAQAAALRALGVRLGIGRIVALHYRSSIHSRFTKIIGNAFLK